jgi:parallel beta-helix repeat protein
VAIETRGNSTLRRNRINRNSGAAVRIYQDGGGVLEENDLTDNDGGAWNIDAARQGYVTRTRNLE